MKKWITVILSALLSAFLVLPVQAKDGIVQAANKQLDVTSSIPEERQLPRLVDGADLVSILYEEELLGLLDEISERQQCDIVVVTTDSLGGKTPTAYADDFYDYNGYGIGKQNDGILLLVSMEDRDWAISTCGYGITAFTDKGQAYMTKKIVPLLSEGEYFKAFSVYAELCDDFLTEAKTNKPYDAGHMPKESSGLSWIRIFASVACGFLIALIMGLFKKQKLKSVAKQYDAQEYIVPGSMVVTQEYDHFVHRQVTTRKIDQDSGSSTHTSSSGTTHGGSSGKF